MRSRSVLVTTVLLFVVIECNAQNADKPIFVDNASSKFDNVAGVPACLTVAPQQGDAGKEASVVQLKLASGCVVPWHWHTPNEKLLLVSGRAKWEMKEGPPATLGSGDFAYMPAKEVHRFSCLSSCVVFSVIDGRFDIHYVDGAGNEIPSEQALKAKSRLRKPATPAK